MNELNFKNDVESLHNGDKTISVPSLAGGTAVSMLAPRKGLQRSARRRLNATRLAQANDDGFRPFRIY